MKSKNGKLYIFFSILVGSYLVFKTVFFDFLGHASVDILIACSIFLLFFLIYKKSRFFFKKYLLSLNKNLYLNFISLFKLLISFRKLILGYNRVYLEYFRYNFYALRIVSKSMSVIFNKLSVNLTTKFLINLFLNKLILKFNFIKKQTTFLPVEYVIFGNSSLIELNIFLSYDVLFFIL